MRFGFSLLLCFVAMELVGAGLPIIEELASEQIVAEPVEQEPCPAMQQVAVQRMPGESVEEERTFVAEQVVRLEPRVYQEQREPEPIVPADNRPGSPRLRRLRDLKAHRQRSVRR